MNKLLLTISLLASVSLLNASKLNILSTEQPLEGASDVRRVRTIENTVAERVSKEGIDVLRDFRSPTRNIMAYVDTLQSDSLIISIMEGTVRARIDGIVQYIASRMKEYTIAESNPYFDQALAGIAGNQTIQLMIFREYVSTDNTEALIQILSTMSALKELRLLDVREGYGHQMTKNDMLQEIVKAINERRLKLEKLVLDHNTFQDNDVRHVITQTGIEVRLSTTQDF